MAPVLGRTRLTATGPPHELEVLLKGSMKRPLLLVKNITVVLEYVEYVEYCPGCIRT